MKFKTNKLTSTLSLVLLLCLLLTFTACGDHSRQQEDTADTTDTAENVGEVIFFDGDGDESSDSDGDGSGDTVQNITKNITQNITNNDVTITADNTNSTTYATASGLRSAVSVYCTFKTTSGGNTPWNPTPTTQTYYSAGSGVIYKLEDDGSAFIITNFHVVYDSSSNTANGISDEIYVYLYGLESEKYAISATYVGGSANYDIAVLRVNASTVLQEAYASGAASAVGIADSDTVSPGQTAIAIGNPSADELSGISVTSGIVSVDSEYITMTSSTSSDKIQLRVIRTDAPVNSGNSGGGLYNDEGKLIGIVNAKISSSEIENIGYAIPSNIARACADNIIYHCYNTNTGCESVMRVKLGITVQVSNCSTYYDLDTGLMVRKEEISVYSLTSGGLGEAVLKTNDIIESITVGEKTVTVTRQHHLIDAMLDARVGDTVSLTVLRSGEELTVSITVTDDCLSAY